MTFKDRLNDFLSSVKYRIFIDGNAMKISITAGKIVQILSSCCPSSMVLLKFFIIKADRIMYMVSMVISITTIMV